MGKYFSSQMGNILAIVLIQLAFITALINQKNYGIISGVNRTGFAGAYWGNGFHEDGINSAYNAIKYFKEAIK